MTYRIATLALAAGVFLALCAAALSATPPDSTQRLLSALQWRSIGPYDGGRVVAVAGVPNEPNTFFMGAVQGGIWESKNYGMTWDNISDGQLGKLANGIGAIAVSPSNPRIIYAGTGESDIRQDFANGDGVYKSSDGGVTWKYAGLRQTRQTSSIVVDPRDANIAYVSSMGHVFRPNSDRGVFKTIDGGRVWKKILFVDDRTGANNVSMDPRNPDVLYASMWQAQRTPWALTSGGPGSGLYKSTDAGAHWKNISTNPGLPHGPLGKTGVAVAPSNSNVVYAIVQARDGGVFRSDTAGATWKRVNDEWKLRQRAFYFGSITVDPKNWRVAYAPQADNVFKTLDGGHTWHPLGAGIGDAHIVWVNPSNPKLLEIGFDGGAAISVDGGQTFSPNDNQAIGQFYHLTLDNQFPYHVYGSQQDIGALEMPSASSEGLGPNVVHWLDPGESTYVAVDPRNPAITYGALTYSTLQQVNLDTGDVQNVTPWAVYKPRLSAIDQRYRFGWTHPVVFSPTKENVLFEAAQVVFRSDDDGQTWRTISPDLTRDDKAVEGPSGGPIYFDQTGAETFPYIASLGLSPLDPDVIWAGSADGLVNVTTDGGAHWKNVTPPDLPQWAQISSIEPSPIAAGTAFVSASRYKWDDFRPYIYETTDYGATWRPMTFGLPSDQTVFALRIDPREPRVVFAATRSSVYLSVDGGVKWQSLRLNLPVCEVRDVQIDAREGEVAVATHGRGIWILDHLAQVEDMARRPLRTANRPTLLHPEDAWLTHSYGGGGAPGGASNPDYGATIFFDLPEDYDGHVPTTLRFLDAKGNVVRSFSMHALRLAENPPSSEDPASVDAITFARAQLQQATGVKAGINKFLWDLRYPPPAEIAGHHLLLTDDYDDEVLGPTVLPGDYTVELRYGNETETTRLHIRLDPRVKPQPDALADRLALATEIATELNALDNAVNGAYRVRWRLTTSKRRQLDQLLLQVEASPIASTEADTVYGSRLRDGLAFLMNSLDLAFKAPTVAQRAAYEELKAEADHAIAKMMQLTAPPSDRKFDRPGGHGFIDATS